MHIATLSMIFSCLLLAGPAAHAQQARCTDSNGMGYACGGSAARSAIHPGHTGGMPHREPRATYMDPSQRSQYTGSNLSQYSSSGSSAPSSPIRHQKKSFDAWPSALHQEPFMPKNP